MAGSSNPSGGQPPGVDVSANAVVDMHGALIPLEPLVIEHGAKVYSGVDKARMSYEMTPMKARHPALAIKIRGLVSNLCRALRFRHYARFDFRCDLETGAIIFLEANYCPSFAPDDDFAVSASASGLSHHELLKRVLCSADADRSASIWFEELPGSVKKIWNPDSLASLVRCQNPD